MGDLLTWLAVLSAYLFGRIAEKRIHRFNYDLLTFAGAEELIPRLMKWYYRLLFVFIPIGLLEFIAAQFRAPEWLPFAALGMIASAQLLRLWVIQTMGRLWTMRCMALPGASVLKTGPFRFLRHPEYVSRVLDGMGIFLFVGSWVTALLYAVAVSAIALKISKIERRQLSEFASEPI